MATIKGVWRIKKSALINLPTTDTTQRVNFTSFFYNSATGVFDTGVGASIKFNSARMEVCADGLFSVGVNYFYEDEYPASIGCGDSDGVDLDVRPTTEEYDGVRQIDFGEAEQTVNDAWYAIFTANATQLKPATVTYNGRTVAELAEGRTATLNCAGAAMVTDVTVTGPCSVEYWGKEIAKVNEGQTGTLRCRGKRMMSDLVVTAIASRTEG